MLRRLLHVFLESRDVDRGWVETRFPSPHLLMEPSVSCELDRIGHVLPYARPRCDGSEILEVLAQPRVERASYALLLMLWIDPDIEPELLRMIHPGNMLTLGKPDWFVPLVGYA